MFRDKIPNQEFCTCKVIFQKRRRNKAFLDKEKLMEFVASRPDLQEILQEILFFFFLMYFFFWWKKDTMDSSHGPVPLESHTETFCFTFCILLL
jgi:hypothetical protein